MAFAHTSEIDAWVAAVPGRNLETVRESFANGLFGHDDRTNNVVQYWVETKRRAAAEAEAQRLREAAEAESARMRTEMDAERKIQQAQVKRSVAAAERSAKWTAIAAIAAAVSAFGALIGAGATAWQAKVAAQAQQSISSAASAPAPVAASRQ